LSNFYIIQKFSPNREGKRQEKAASGRNTPKEERKKKKKEKLKYGAQTAPTTKTRPFLPAGTHQGVAGDE